jgi:hypothetical protein
MAPVNLQDIIKKYNFKTISVATWRDPRGSTLPARGGPTSPTISAEAAAKPYIPTYKVVYNVPEPTDDEASDGEDERKNVGASSGAAVPGGLIVATAGICVLT